MNVLAVSPPVSNKSAFETGRATVSVLIVNYKTVELTIAAAESALRQPDAQQIIVVDNASDDGSVTRLQMQFAHEPRVLIVASEANVGFGQGNNLAATYATSDLLFLLNSDATFHDNALRNLVDFRATLQARAAVVAPLVFGGPHGSAVLQTDAVGYFPTAIRTLTRRAHHRPQEDTPDWVSGCGLMIDRHLFSELNGFDKRFFMYLEDVHLCWRCRQIGVPIHRCTTASIQHLGGASAGTLSDTDGRYGIAHEVYLAAVGTPRVLRTMVRLARRVTTRRQLR